MKIRSSLMLTAISLMSASAFAGGYTTPAVPTNIEVMDTGVLIAGSFGDPQGCSRTNYVFVPRSNPSFKEIMVMAITAITASRQLQFYVDICTAVPVHWSGNVINQSSDNTANLL